MRGSTIVLMCLLIMGCGSRDGEVARGSMVSEGLAGSLGVEVGEDSVHLSLHVTNDTSSPMSFTFPSSQRYEFVIRTASGAEVWRWSTGRSFMQALVDAELPAGDTWTFESAWDPGSHEGTFVAEGRLTAMERSVVQEMTFELP